MAQHAGIGRIESRCAHQIIDRVRVTPGGFQKAARMKCKFARVRVEVACSSTVNYGAVEPSRGGEGTTGVAVSFSP